MTNDAGGNPTQHKTLDFVYSCSRSARYRMRIGRTVAPARYEMRMG